MENNEPLSGFEDYLEVELQKKNRGLFGRKTLDLLNQPFVLWVLSTLAIGFLSFSFTNYNSCRMEISSDKDRLSKDIAEITLRQLLFIKSFPKEIDTEAGLNKAKSLTDPEKTYFYKNFKGVKIIELAMDVTDIAGRWHLENETIKGYNYPKSPIKLIEEQAQSMNLVIGLMSWLSYESDSEKSKDLRNDILRYVKDLSNHSGMTPNYWTAGWTGPPVCARRSIWPR